MLLRAGYRIYNLDLMFKKGGSAMSNKLKTALDYLERTAAIIAVVADAGKKVMSLCKG